MVSRVKSLMVMGRLLVGNDGWDGLVVKMNMDLTLRGQHGRGSDEIAGRGGEVAESHPHQSCRIKGLNAGDKGTELCAPGVQPGVELDMNLIEALVKPVPTRGEVGIHSGSTNPIETCGELLCGRMQASLAVLLKDSSGELLGLLQGLVNA